MAMAGGSSSAPRQQRPAPLALFWDVDSCPLPADVAAEKVARNVRLALRGHPATAAWQMTSFSAYSDFNLLPRKMREGLQRTGINLCDIPNGRKDSIDKAILADLFLFAMDHQAPAAIVLVSADVDFATSLHKLSQRGFLILLAVPGHVSLSRCFTSAARHVWDWGALLRGAGLVTVTGPGPGCDGDSGEASASGGESARREGLRPWAMLHQKKAGCLENAGEAASAPQGQGGHQEQGSQGSAAVGDVGGTMNTVAQANVSSHEGYILAPPTNDLAKGPNFCQDAAAGDAFPDAASDASSDSSDNLLDQSLLFSESDTFGSSSSETESGASSGKDLLRPALKTKPKHDAPPEHHAPAPRSNFTLIPGQSQDAQRLMLEPLPPGALLASARHRHADVDVLRARLCRMVQANGGRVALGSVPSEYRRLFGASLFLADYGASKIAHLVSWCKGRLRIQGTRTRKWLVLAPGGGGARDTLTTGSSSAGAGSGDSIRGDGVPRSGNGEESEAEAVAVGGDPEEIILWQGRLGSLRGNGSKGKGKGACGGNDVKGTASCHGASLLGGGGAGFTEVAKAAVTPESAPESVAELATDSGQVASQADPFSSGLSSAPASSPSPPSTWVSSLLSIQLPHLPLAASACPAWPLEATGGATPWAPWGGPLPGGATLGAPGPWGSPPGGATLGPLAVFWDIENCCLPSDVSADAVGMHVRQAVREHPATAACPVTVFSAYGDFSMLPRRIREGCQRTGINLLDVPNGRKDAADKAILADLFLFALDNPPPASILLISSDVDFATCVQRLSQRQYRIFLSVLGNGMVSGFLTSAAEEVWDWGNMARGRGAVTAQVVSGRDHEAARKAEGRDSVDDSAAGSGTCQGDAWKERECCTGCGVGSAGCLGSFSACSEGYAAEVESDFEKEDDWWEGGFRTLYA